MSVAAVKDFSVTWFKAARAPFLIVSAVPTCLGGAIAWSLGEFDAGLFLLVLVGVVMAQSAADFVDDYFDYYNGNLGNKDQQFHDSPLLDGKITPGQVLFAAIASAVIAVAVGIILFLEVGMPVLYLTLFGMFIVVFYTAPPLRLNYRGFGEFALFVAFGPALVLGAVYVLTGELSWAPILASVPLGIFTMNVGHVSNTFDHPDDLRSGKITLAVRLGQATAVKALAIFSVVAYLVPVLGVVFGLLPIWCLLVLLTAPLAVRVVILTNRYDVEGGYTPAMTSAIACTTVTGVLMCAAYLIPTG